MGCDWNVLSIVATIYTIIKRQWDMRSTKKFEKESQFL